MSYMRVYYYENELEDEFSSASIKAKNAIQSMSAPEYIKTSLKYLEEEQQRKNEYINKAFWLDLDGINNKHFVEANAKILSEMETGFRYMLKNKKDDYNTHY